MKFPAALIMTLAVCCAALTAHAAEDSTSPGTLTGVLGVAAMYDSNLDLARDLPADTDSEGDFVYQLNGKLGVNWAWEPRWMFEFDLQGLGYWPHYYTEEAWFVGNTGLYTGLSLGSNTISVVDSLRYFTAPRSQAADLLRNAVTVGDKQTFSSLWEGLLGYENIVSHHPGQSVLDYAMNGGFVEIRNTWTPLISSYYSFDYLYYVGRDEPTATTYLNPPEHGYRYSAEVGFDALFALRHNLQMSYTFQVDRGSYPEGNNTDSAAANDDNNNPPPPPGSGGQPGDHRPPQTPLDQVGGFEGEQASLEVDAEFNYIKHKATLLYSVRLNDRYSLTLYNEFLYKDFDFPDSAPALLDLERIDRLLLTSAWFTARLYNQIHAKACYVFRTSLPTDDEDRVQEHIGSVGLEYRF